ncbi:dipeptidase [Thermodesulfobacteriota bacterium]
MNDKLIVTPDEDLIAELSKEFKKAESKPGALYVDGHIDLPYYMMNSAPEKTFDDLDQGPVTPQTVRESGIRLFTTAIYCLDMYNGEKAFTHFQQNLDYTKKILENVSRIRSKKELEELKNNKEAIGTIFLLKNADVLSGNNSLLLSLRGQGIYIVGLTHAGTNRLADGNSIQHSDGITPEGRDVIRGLLDNNILIDAAHLHPSCFWKLMDIVETPCVSSCTGIKERCNIPGNLDLEQAKQIFEREGLVGITFNSEMLSMDGEAEIEDIFIHIDTVVQKFGPDFVALGSDFCGFDKFIKDMEDLTGISNLEKIMSGHGYKIEDMEKILGLNWLRIYERLL